MAGPKDKKKKPKLTKAEKDKLKKEEAERKAKEEEEERLLAEQADREREEREKIEREERRLLEETERVRHQAEIDELNKELEVKKQYLKDLRKSGLEKSKWNRYMLCDGRPVPSCKKDINSFINLMREDMSCLDIGKVLESCQVVLQLIDELDANIEELNEEYKDCKDNDLSIVASDEGDEKEDKENGQEEKGNEEITLIKAAIASYKETKEDLQNLIAYKIDASTQAMLKAPGQNIDPDDLNIQFCEQTDDIKVCIWGNSAKNPRIKQITFCKDPFTMELPKQMALLDIAVRVLYMNFDPFSSKCSTNIWTPKKEAEAVPIIDVEALSPEEEKCKDEIPDGDKLNVKSALFVAAASKNTMSVKDISKIKSRSGTGVSIADSTTKGSVVSILNALDGSQETDEKVEQGDVGDFVDEDVVDLRLFSPVGNLIYIEILQLPPQAREVNGWKMQQVTGKDLIRVPFGEDIDVCSSSLSTSSKSGAKSNTHLSKRSTTQLSSIGYSIPIAISLRVDQKVIFHEDPQIARWDGCLNHWKVDGITDQDYDRETGMLSFRTIHFGPFAVIQDKYLNLPYQSWQLSPRSLNECVLNLTGVSVELNIHIKDGYCCLQFPDEMKQVGHITNKWMKPFQLIKCLQSVGINFFPGEDGDKYVKIFPKVAALVTPIYQHMALLSSCFSFILSKWNNECGDEKVVLQALEWIDSENFPESSHGLYVATTRVSYKLNMHEYAEEFSEDVYPNSQMHPDLYHMLRDGASDWAKQRIKETSVVFMDCVHQLLIASNILVYS